MDHINFRGRRVKLQEMIARILCFTACLLILLSLPATVTASPLQSEQEEKEKEEKQEEEEEEKKFAVLGGWLNDRDPLNDRDSLAGMRYAAHQVRRLQPFPRGMGHDLQAYVEEETIQVNPQTTRVVTRTYHDDGFGSRRLVSVTEETRTVKKDGQEEAVRTISRPDANGRLQVEEEQTQRVVSRADNEFEVQTVVSMPGADRRLHPVEQFVQTERRQADGTVELDLTSYVVDSNGQWQPVKRHTAVTRTVGGESRTEEEVYQADLNRRLSLTDRITSREWQDENGTLRRTIETRSVNPQGKLQLAERVNTVRTTDPDGSVKIVQDLELRHQGSGRMQLFERIVSSSTPEDEAEGSTELRVKTPDNNGRLTIARTYREDRSGAEGSERQTRTVKKQ